MCLTAHFVDANWNLHKRILNFCPISGHKGEEIGKCIDRCLLDWNIGTIFSITVDNASSNDGAIVYLQKKFDNWGNNILGGKYVHVRCIAHIINLVVQDELKGNDEHVAISRVRGAVRYIRSSPARWNSTYLMLESAICLKRAFDAYDEVDLAYRIDLSKKPYDGVPNEHDWERSKLLLKFLKHFYKLTLRISGSLYVTSNIMFHEISEVDMLLKQWLESADFELSLMAKRMKEKYDKYWGSTEKMNMILYYAVILDPRHKLEFVEFSFDRMYGSVGKNETMKEQVRLGLYDLFDDYKLRHSNNLPDISKSLCSSSNSSTLGSQDMSKKRLCEADDKSEMAIRLSLKQEFKMYKSGGSWRNI
ncbi:zinc finger BED domain-containing protein RICESLEEPER 2-like [Primulina tabacum]|uniref:zinc finger BED domain-containing protein RICESLEEPER 2-like n=1 Tax=Primulina tabacum TaxID=48773 RepID=UPI003F59C126